MVLFSASLVVSHYGLSYIYLGSILFSWCISVVIKANRTFFSKFFHKIYIFDAILSSKSNFLVLSPNYVLLFSVLSLSWYIFTSHSSAFSLLINVNNHIYNSIFTNFLDSKVTEGLYLVTLKTSLIHDVTKYLHIFTQIFISIGLLYISIIPNNLFNKDFLLISWIYFLIFIASIIIPSFSSSLNTTRLYHIGLFFLAPFFIIGTIKFFSSIEKIINHRIDEKVPIKFISVFLAIFLLFNSGFIYEITKDHPTSISLSQKSILRFGDESDIMNFYDNYIPEEDLFGATWLSLHRNNTYKLYSDDSVTPLKCNVLVSKGCISYLNIHALSKFTTVIPSDSYLFLRYVNVRENLIQYRSPSLFIKMPIICKTDNIDLLIDNNSKIYSNGANYIFVY
ncbi:DUF2206 domain-containing protein [Methanosarcina vacuolata]